MSLISQEQMELKARQREAEERARARRRAELQEEIAAINSKINSIQNIINDLKKEQENLRIQMGRWENQKSIYDANDILSEVVITNVFQGKIADKLKADFETCILQMELTCTNVNGLSGNMTSQIKKLNQNKALLVRKLTLLTSELNSIERRRL